MQYIIDFLNDLARNNNREWFLAHRERYETAKAQFEAFTQELLNRMTSVDSRLLGLQVKDCTYRIYQDMRFHHRLPYKTHFALSMCPQGKKSGRAEYYLHLSPVGEDGESFFALYSGLYTPSPEAIREIRQTLRFEGEGFQRAIEQADRFSVYWENALKNVPKGFSADDAYSEYYHLKSYLLGCQLSLDEVLSPHFLDTCVEQFSATTPFVEWLNKCVDNL